MARTIVDALIENSTRQPERIAVAFKSDTVSYGDLYSYVRGTAKVLHDQYGVDCGDFVVLSGVSMPEFVVCYLAVQYLGAVSVPVDKGMKDGGKDINDYVHPKVMLLNRKGAEGLDNCVLLKDVYGEGKGTAVISDDFLYEHPSDDDLSEIILTTGTTGKPKGVMLSIGNICAIEENMCRAIGITGEDAELIPLPLNHSLGLRAMRAMLWTGGTAVLQNGFTFAKEIENNLNAYNCTGFVSTPASFEMIYRQMQDRFSDIIGRFRYIEIGAGSLGLDMKQRIPGLLPETKVVNTWGSSETGGAIFLELSKYPEKAASVGTPVEGADIKVVDAAGNETRAISTETAGRLALRGKMCMLGYYNLPEKNKETLIDGWLFTNDLVYRDKEGFVYMLGRADDIINIGGEKVSPLEVENAAQTFEQIRECACIGVDDPDGILGQIPVLYVVPEESEFDKNALTKYLSSKLENYKMPRCYMVIEKLPRNSMEKLDRGALKRMWSENKNEDLSEL